MANFGNKVVLNCKVTVIIWKKKDRTLFVGDLKVTYDKKITVQGTNFTIFNTTFDDKGYYRCGVEKSDG